MAPQSIEEYIVQELIRDTSNTKIVRQYLEKLDRVEILRLFDNFLDKDDTKAEIKIPVSILRDRRLSSLELIVKFLREETGLSNAAVSSILGRSQQVCWNTYNNSRKKVPERLGFEFSGYDIPVRMFRDTRLSVLEAIVVFLKEEFRLSYHEIAMLLKRDDRTIWTVHERAGKK